MTFEILSPGEVRAKYNRAPNKKQMLGVLADLTCSTEDEVADFLGVEIPTAPGRINTKKAYRLYKEKKSDIQIAKELGVSRQAVYDWRVSRDLPQLNVKAGDKERMDAYNRGLSDRKAALELGISREAFRHWRHKNGLQPNY